MLKYDTGIYKSWLMC